MQDQRDAKAAKKAAFEAFRHEQTVKRWLHNNTSKPSKLVYLSDFLEYGAGATALASQGAAQKNASGRGERRQKCLVPGTLYHNPHRWTCRVPREHRQTAHMPSKKAAKQRDPHSDVPYNHRKKWSKLKRTIFDTRKRVFESQPTETVVEASADARAEEDHVEWQRVANGIHQLEALYVSLDAAMQQRQFRLAAILKHRLRRKRWQLQWQVRRYVADHEETTAERSAAHCGENSSPPQQMREEGSQQPVSAQSPPHDTVREASVKQGVYSSFYPSTVLLKVGQHPHHATVDRRTGRCPRALPTETVQSLARSLADEAMAAQSGEAAAPPAASAATVLTPATNRLFLGAYCRNVLDDTLEDLLFTLLQSLYVEQREIRQKQPLQFKARQRYVVGLHETIKFLRAGRVKLVLLAGDMEVVMPEEEEEASERLVEDDKASAAAPRAAPPKRKFQTLEEAVTILHDLCGLGVYGATTAEAKSTPPRPGVPCVCTMTRQRLSYALYAKGSKISCVGVLHSDKHAPLLRAAIGYSQKMLRQYDGAVTRGTDAA